MFARLADEALDHETPSQQGAREALSDGGSVLDVGCGAGLLAEPLARLGARIAAVDAAPELIDAARNGRMFILVDDEDRENEGDLVIPAQMATPDAINFMAKHGRGLICLALAKQRVDQLGLQLMSRHNGTRHETAFTTSI
ncbi:MAG: 3,4-dihydroxy-2-butanone-4-phosphate synthase, partial [Actinobacteria bacterium]|nr:3,4-dihydroxy-2-butanone-4-phosphate synthase [Actinomycetota bacterium]